MTRHDRHGRPHSENTAHCKQGSSSSFNDATHCQWELAANKVQLPYSYPVPGSQTAFLEATAPAFGGGYAAHLQELHVARFARAHAKHLVRAMGEGKWVTAILTAESAAEKEQFFELET